MKRKSIFLTITICIYFIFQSSNVYAQKPKVAIVSLADSTLIYQSIGLTIFKNAQYPFPADIPIIHYMIQSITKHIGQSYDVQVFIPSESVINENLNQFPDGNIEKKMTKWASEQKEYAHIVFLKNKDVSSQSNMIVPDNTSGLYSRSNLSFVYTTIAFYDYNASKSKLTSFENRLLHRLKDFNIPKDKKTYTPEMIQTIESEFRSFIDERIEKFLAKTFKQ